MFFQICARFPLIISNVNINFYDVLKYLFLNNRKTDWNLIILLHFGLLHQLTQVFVPWINLGTYCTGIQCFYIFVAWFCFAHTRIIFSCINFCCYLFRVYGLFNEALVTQTLSTDTFIYILYLNNFWFWNSIKLKRLTQNGFIR